jgi:hypothetical protein
VLVQADWWAVFHSLTNKMHDMNHITGTWVYVSLLPTYTSTLFSSHIKHTASIPNSLDNMWLAHINASHSITHPITYTTL